MTQKEVLDLMSSSTTSQEWNQNCLKVKEAHKGEYPSYWYAEVITSGLMDRTLGEGSSKIKVSTHSMRRTQPDKERIEMSDTTFDIIKKMSDGNQGAMMVLMRMLQSNVDPDSAFGPLGAILSLDSFRIYGTDIFVLSNDICDGQMNKMIAVLRAVQLGLFDRKTLREACSKQDGSGRMLIPVEELYEKVKVKLPDFDPQPVKQTDN